MIMPYGDRCVCMCKNEIYICLEYLYTIRKEQTGNPYLAHAR